MTTGPARIELRGLRVVSAHGVLAEELTRSQPFELDLDLLVVVPDAARTDALIDTVDYAAALAAAAEVMAGPPRLLLETLAEAVADRLLADPRVLEVGVTIRKLRPPVPYDLASAGVRITRTRP